jgi:hypothetical protein
MHRKMPVRFEPGVAEKDLNHRHLADGLPVYPDNAGLSETSSDATTALNCGNQT